MEKSSSTYPKQLGGRSDHPTHPRATALSGGLFLFDIINTLVPLEIQGAIRYYKHINIKISNGMATKSKGNYVDGFVLTVDKKKDPVMNDPKWKNMPMPFDMKRMAYGGFKVLVSE